MDEHNGWHAYRLIAARAGLTTDINWYAHGENTPNYVIYLGGHREEIVRIIEEEYGVTLTEDDRKFILDMKTPHELCVDFPNRFNPNHYPDLKSDRPPEKDSTEQNPG
ncbi:MAG: hypothetical protein A2570_03745 [Candidatus Brennerbacteria bacterium RIFOXYD1_FULL_41_16]|uniref:Uncharacterized protein n=1 Tax=Candidatus Brennerbacteria bacterium RIFOXYD1_FULL_41_16 TaxID=1797529 RepID=A0A1G1XK80_9BACT|nr:MAG: hypothetical protein A2570_03745 [Candidatus Brennerbacteria bacterium RIFOXYD1_FULL_41_16]